MKSYGSQPITVKSEVDQTVFGVQETEVKGRQNKNKELVAMGVKKKKKGISRMYARVTD